MDDTYFVQNNVSRVYDVYQTLFLLQQRNRSISSYYSSFKKLMDLLDQYHPITSDIEVLKKQREEFFVSKFLTGLSPSLRAEKAQILSGEGYAPSLINVYARALRIFNASSSSSTSEGFCNGSMSHDYIPVPEDVLGNHGDVGIAFGGNGYSHRGGGSSNRGGRSNRDAGRGRGGSGGRSFKNCTHCGGVNHSIDQCYHLHGRPPPQYKRSSTTSTPAAKSEFVANNEQKSKQVPSPVSAASIAAQEACEKWRLRGNECYSKDELAKADEYYTNGVTCVSESETSKSCLEALKLCYSNRAATRMALERFREAIEDCKLAAVIDPNFLKVQLRAAKCYLSMGEVEEALQYFKKCLPSDDKKIKDEASEGIQKAQKVSECMSQSAEFLGRRTSINIESAMNKISEALKISPHSEKLLQEKAASLSLLQKYEEVIELCEQSVKFAEMNGLPLKDDGQAENSNSSTLPKSFLFKNWRFSFIFKCYFNLGKIEEARDFVEKHNELRNGNKAPKSSLPVAVTNILELLSYKEAGNEAFKSGRHEEAVKHYTAALACNIESRLFAAICFGNRAAAYKSLGRITDAIADCSLAIAFDTNYFKALSRRASLFEMIRDYGQAASDLQRLVSFLTEQVEGKTNQCGPAGKSTSFVNELRQAKLRLSEMKREARQELPLNMYLILGITSSVPASEIKPAYKKAALKHHPDKVSKALANKGEDDGLCKEIAEEVYKDADKLFKMIGGAYAVLSDPNKRSLYDFKEAMESVYDSDSD